MATAAEHVAASIDKASATMADVITKHTAELAAIVEGMRAQSDSKVVEDAANKLDAASATLAAAYAADPAAPAA